MMSTTTPKNRYGKSWLWPAGLILVFLVVGLLLQSWLNHEPGQQLVERETRGLRQLSQAVWNSTPDKDFTGLNTASAIQDRLVPVSMLRDSGHLVRNSWGGAVEIKPHGVRATADGFLVQYHSLPPLACTQLVRSTMSFTYDIRVNGHSVLASSGARPEELDRACRMGQSTVDFVFHPDLVPGTALPRI